MALTQRPRLLSEVLVRKDQSVYATVNVPEGSAFNIGTMVLSTDGGLTWDAQTTPVWVAGIYSAIEETFYSGHVWKSLIDANDAAPGTDPAKWEDRGLWEPNGVLLEYADETGEYEVMSSGYVREKYVTSFSEAMRSSLFANKIILK
jgi:hypothetical protein